jgi:predicted porin
LEPENQGNYFAGKTQNFEAVVQYQFDFGLRPSIGYVHVLVEVVPGTHFDVFNQIRIAAGEAAARLQVFAWTTTLIRVKLA